MYILCMLASLFMFTGPRAQPVIPPNLYCVNENNSLVSPGNVHMTKLTGADTRKIVVSNYFKTASTSPTRRAFWQVVNLQMTRSKHNSYSGRGVIFDTAIPS